MHVQTYLEPVHTKGWVEVKPSLDDKPPVVFGSFPSSYTYECSSLSVMVPPMTIKQFGSTGPVVPVIPVFSSAHADVYNEELNSFIQDHFYITFEIVNKNAAVKITALSISIALPKTNTEIKPIGFKKISDPTDASNKEKYFYIFDIDKHEVKRFDLVFHNLTVNCQIPPLRFLRKKHWGYSPCIPKASF